MKNAYLIHGTSTRDDDWFPWLEEERNQQSPLIGYGYQIPLIPNKLNGIKRLMTKFIPKITSSLSLIVSAALRPFVILNVIMLKMHGFYWWEHLIRDYQLIPN